MTVQNKIFQKQTGLLANRYPKLKSSIQSIIEAYLVMENSFQHDGKLLIAGNGGSAADAEHIAGELMKCFKIPRPITDEYAAKLKAADAVIGAEIAGKLEQGLAALPLAAHEAFSTAYANDVDESCTFAQQLFVLGRPGDVFLGISTSGNSRNILNAAVAARARGMKVVGLTGADGGRLAAAADVAVKVPEKETYMVQELHLPVYHCWCLMLEERFFGT
ncbi:MAG: SIS domain-containing protein [Eubacterium sp.]|nr:SIS domain-containing protein [Eubacterium sp.]